MVAEQKEDAGPAVDGGLEQLVDQTVLVDALRQLSAPHQQIVVERFYADTPLHLTAARLGVSAGTVRSRLHYALGQLRRQLDPGAAA
ncbi:MAG TPA: sigma-70 family RNA polymerase sigma factor [Jatrophihabitantaceae bacterium]